MFGKKCYWNKVKKNKITADGWVYTMYMCPKCKNETIIQTNYCSHCGKRLRKEPRNV